MEVVGGSLADKAGLIPGDAVVKVNDYDVFSLRHKDAQDIIVRSGNCFDPTLQRGGSTWRPHVTATGSLPTPSSQLGNIAPVTMTSLAHKQQEVRHIGSGYNNSARPYGGINGTDGHVKSIVNKPYNSPVGIYSEEAIAEILSAQAEVLAGGVLGVNFKKNEKIYNAANSEVLKMLHEQENDPDPDEQDPYQSTLQHSPRPRYEHEQPHYNTNPTVTKHVTALWQSQMCQILEVFQLDKIFAQNVNVSLLVSLFVSRIRISTLIVSNVPPVVSHERIKVTLISTIIYIAIFTLRWLL